MDNSMTIIHGVMRVRGPNNVQTNPTLLRHASAITEQKKCREFLAQKFDRFQALHNNSQQYATTCNRVCKRTQHVTSNNVASVCTGLALRCWSCLLALKRMTLQSLQRLRNKRFLGKLSPFFVCLFVCLYTGGAGSVLFSLVRSRSWPHTVRLHQEMEVSEKKNLKLKQVACHKALVMWIYRVF